MKYLEIKDGTGMVFDNTSTPGVYEQLGHLYFCPGGGLYPITYPLSSFPWRQEIPKESTTVQNNSGISEDLFLKAIAISQKPELVSSCVNK